MSVPRSIIASPTPPEIRRAKKSKHCSQYFGRIEAGTRYLLVDPWNWIHIWHSGETRS